MDIVYQHNVACNSSLRGKLFYCGKSSTILYYRYTAPCTGYACICGIKLLIGGFFLVLGTHELAHLEMVSAILYQLTRNLSVEEIKAGGFDAYYVDHTTGIWTQAASGAPFTAAYYQSKGDPLTDLFEDMAAEQKARTTYENLIRAASDPDVIAPLRFLREREIVHFQRFGEALAYVQSQLDAENYYQCNPAFD